MKTKKKRIASLLVLMGALMIMAALAGVVFMTVSSRRSAVNCEQIVSRIRAVIPNVRAEAPDSRVDNLMPCVSIDGDDFAAIIEIPVFSRTLPVYASWDGSRRTQFPCRYAGSMYDGSLVIGCSDSEGQVDFVSGINVSDAVYVTDMTGARYSYTVADIEISTDVSTEHLCEGDYDLVLFVSEAYSSSYTIIRCRN